MLSHEYKRMISHYMSICNYLSSRDYKPCIHITHTYIYSHCTAQKLSQKSKLQLTQFDLLKFKLPNYNLKFDTLATDISLKFKLPET